MTSARLFAPLLALAACAHRPPAAAPPAPAVVAPAPTLDDALASITRASIERDLAAVARPRHHRAAPEGLRAVRSYVAEQLAAAGMTVASQPVEHDGAVADNVIGERAGRAGHVVLVGAHYDAVEGTPGADDNATGVAVMLAVARATAVLRPEATVRCVAFAFEEQWLVGSRAYVEALPEAERRRIRAAIVVDMAGYTSREPGSQRYPGGLPDVMLRALPDRGDFLGVATSDPLRALLREAQSRVPGLRLQVITEGFARAVPDLLRGDHASFWAAGIPAVMGSDTAEMRTPHYHRPSDTVATLDLDFTLRVARWAAAATLLAARDAPLPR